MVDDRYRRRDEHGYGRNQERGSYKEFYGDRDRYGASGHANNSTAYGDEDYRRAGGRDHDWDSGNGGFDRGRGRLSSGDEASYGVHGPEDYARGHSGYGRGDYGQSRRAGGDLYGRDRYPGNSSREGYAGMGERFAGGTDDYGRDYGHDLESQAYGRAPRSAFGSGMGASQSDYRPWADSGEHRGRGPRGYQRSDDRIREDVSDRLSDDGRVDASDIEVTVSNGEVTLSGTVSSRDQKRRAEDIAEDVSAVKHVQNNIRVKPHTDTDAARSGTDMPGVSTSASSGVTAGTPAGSGSQESQKT